MKLEGYIPITIFSARPRLTIKTKTELKFILPLANNVFYSYQLIQLIIIPSFSMGCDNLGFNSLMQLL
jgi:hypothetical protein